MSTLPNGPPRSLTAQEVDTWLLAAQEQRAHLHLQAAHPWQSSSRQEAFTAMQGTPGTMCSPVACGGAASRKPPA